MKRLRKGKSAGPDRIAIEILLALGEYGIEILKMYVNGKIPRDLLKSVFIALPKKQGAIDCETHRTVSLMSHVTKILLRVIMMRARNRIIPEISDLQRGFVEGKGTVNAIYMLRMIIERSIGVRKDL